MLENRDVSYRERLLTELSTKIGKSQTVYKRLYDELPELEEKHAALDEKVSQHQAAVRTLEATQSALAKEKQQLNQSNQQLRNDISEAQNKKKTVDAALATVRLELETKIEELRSKDTEASQLKALQEANIGLKKKKAEYEIQCSSLQAQSKELSEKIVSQQKELGDFKNIGFELEASKNEIRNLDQKKRVLVRELADCQNQLSELTTQKKDILDQLLDQKSGLASLQNQSKDLKETILQKKQIAGRLEQLESTLLARRADLGKLEEEHQNSLSKFAAEIKISSQKVVDLEATLISEKHVLNDVKKQVEQRRIELEILNTTCQELEDRKSKLSQNLQ